MNMWPGGNQGNVQFVPVPMPSGTQSSEEVAWKFNRRMQKAIKKAVDEATGKTKPQEKKDEGKKPRSFSFLEVVGIVHILSIPIIGMYWMIGKAVLQSMGVLH